MGFEITTLEMIALYGLGGASIIALVLVTLWSVAVALILPIVIGSVLGGVFVLLSGSLSSFFVGLVGGILIYFLIIKA